MSAEFADTLGTKSFDDIVEDTLQSIVQKDIGLSNVNPGSVLRTLVEVLAENEDTLNYYMEYIYNNMNIDNCVGDELDRSVKILGLSREPSKPAIGMVTFYTGDAPAECRCRTCRQVLLIPQYHGNHWHTYYHFARFFAPFARYR